MRDRCKDPSHHEHMIYHGATSRSVNERKSFLDILQTVGVCVHYPPFEQCSTTGVTKAVVCIILSVG